VKMIEILLVEDNEADAFLMQEVFQDSRHRNHLSIAADGVEAMDFLNRRGRFSEAPRPDLILLDLNMPRKDGRAVLQEIKQDLALRCIPVIVLTTSESEEDVRQSYDAHASCYITKPMGLEQMYRVVQGIEDFWFSIVRLPRYP
jgi:two-component system, chemotaxis family, response regulator Rcp1